MSISLPLTQPTGVVATYHKVTGGGYSPTSVTVMVLSFLDNQHTDAQGFAPVAETRIDVSAVLGMPAVTPSTGATFESVFFGGLDQFLVAQQTPAPIQPPIVNADGTTAPAPTLPPINGPFFGGTVVP